MSKSPTTAPNKYETSSIKPHPPKADAWPPISSRAYQGVPSPKSPDWVGPYANGRTHSWPTSTPAEPATHRTEAINGHYRTRQTHRQRLPQPHQLPTPNAPHRRRPRRLHPHPTTKSPISKSREGPRRSRMGVTYKMTVTILIPVRRWYYTCSYTTMTRTP